MFTFEGGRGAWIFFIFCYLFLFLKEEGMWVFQFIILFILLCVSYLSLLFSFKEIREGWVLLIFFIFFTFERGGVCGFYFFTFCCFGLLLKREGGMSFFHFLLIIFIVEGGGGCGFTFSFKKFFLICYYL